jgi:hypothetical protein
MSGTKANQVTKELKYPDNYEKAWNDNDIAVTARVPEGTSTDFHRAHTDPNEPGGDWLSLGSDVKDRNGNYIDKKTWYENNALPNIPEYATEFKPTKDTQVIIGDSASAFGQKGGNKQVLTIETSKEKDFDKMTTQKLPEGDK